MCVQNLNFGLNQALRIFSCFWLKLVFRRKNTTRSTSSWVRSTKKIFQSLSWTKWVILDWMKSTSQLTLDKWTTKLKWVRLTLCILSLRLLKVHILCTDILRENQQLLLNLKTRQKKSYLLMNKRDKFSSRIFKQLLNVWISKILSYFKLELNWQRKLKLEFLTKHQLCFKKRKSNQHMLTNLFPSTKMIWKTLFTLHILRLWPDLGFSSLKLWEEVLKTKNL